VQRQQVHLGAVKDTSRPKNRACPPFAAQSLRSMQALHWRLDTSKASWAGPGFLAGVPQPSRAKERNMHTALLAPGLWLWL